MSYRDSRDSILANIAQQAAGAISFLLLPALLGVREYGQVIFAVTLISFAAFSDLGVTTVYNRKMPAIYARGNAEEVGAWNVTAFRFKLIGAVLFGVAAGLAYWGKYQVVFNAAAFSLLIPLSAVISFFIAQGIVQSRFRQARDLTVMQAISQLLVIPGAAFLGIAGWFAGQLAGIALLFFRKNLRTMAAECLKRSASVNWRLIASNLSEAFMLSLISMLWLQLLLSGRLYAAFFYPDDVLARYGLVNSIYQMGLSLVIAAFVPQTIKVYRMLESDATAAVEYAFKSAVISMPVVWIFVVFCLLGVPPLLGIFYPKYHIESRLFAPLILSLINCSVMAALGTLLIGSGRHRLYLALLIGGWVSYWGVINMLRRGTYFQAAADAQAISLSIFSVSLVVAVYACFRKNIEKPWLVIASAAPSIAAPGVLYFLS